MLHLLRYGVVVVFVLVVSGCAVPQNKLHYSLKDDPQSRLPKKVVLLPLDITVSELTASGAVEKDPQWTEEAKLCVIDATKVCIDDVCFKLQPLPDLSQEELAILEEYLALYDVAAGSALLHTSPTVHGWESKRQHLDYSLGPGLAFLMEKTGADGALMVIGNDYISSPGRKFTFVMAAAAGVAIPMGHCSLVGGVVDLASGDILWLNHVLSEAKSLRSAGDAQAMMDSLMKTYPGLGK